MTACTLKNSAQLSLKAPLYQNQSQTKTLTDSTCSSGLKESEKLSKPKTETQNMCIVATGTALSSHSTPRQVNVCCLRSSARLTSMRWGNKMLTDKKQGRAMTQLWDDDRVSLSRCATMKLPSGWQPRSGHGPWTLPVWTHLCGCLNTSVVKMRMVRAYDLFILTCPMPKKTNFFSKLYRLYRSF